MIRIAAWRNIVVAIACSVAFVDGATAQLAMPEIVQIGITGPRSSETATRMVTAVYKPPGDGKWPVLVYSHGRSGNEADRRRRRTDSAGLWRYGRRGSRVLRRAL